MEVHLKELIDTHKSNRNNANVCIEFRGETLTFDTLKSSSYSPSDQQHILERLFYKYLDLTFENSRTFTIIFDRLYIGAYINLSNNVKTYLFESLNGCSPKIFLPWILQILDNDEEMAKNDTQAFTSYVESKRKRGLTNGEIRYTLVCEPANRLLELIMSKIYRDRLVSKHAWLALFRLKQEMSLTTEQKDIFNQWLGVL